MDFFELLPALPELILAVGILGFVVAAAFKHDKETTSLTYAAIGLLCITLLSHFMG